MHENSAGQILRVEMDSLALLPGQKISLVEGLPRGDWPEMTGGLSTEEFLRVTRGDS